MSHDEDRTNPAPRPSRWVSRLEQSVLPHTDPIRRLAQHVWGDGSTWDIKYDAHGEYGSLHFGPPQKWREQHPFSVPLGIMHAEYGSPPFTPAVEGGKAVVLWLRQDALMNHVSREHQKNVLEKRAQALATAISGKFDIEPLEARLYYPKQSIRDAIKGTDHDCCAALILATDKAHASALEEARKHIIEERANARAKAKNDKHLLPTSPPSDASVETMLSMHRKPATEGKKAEAILQDEYIGLREIVSYASTSPTIVARNEKRKFPISLHGSKELVDPKDLKVDNGTTHVLILPLNQAIVSCVPPGIKLPKDIREIGVAFDEQRVREAIHPIATFLKKTISSHVSYSNKGEPFLCLRTSGEDQEKTLISCKHMFNSCIAKYRAEEADWRNYLDERHIEHRPPSAAR